MTDIFIFFEKSESLVAAVAAYMRDHNLTPAEVLAAHDAWLAERMAEMVPPGSPTRLRREPPPRGEVARRAGGSASARHRAGSVVQLPHACPRCGAGVHMEQLCRIASPHWRTQLACMADNCAWNGLSVLPIDSLLAAGATNLKRHVQEG